MIPLFFILLTAAVILFVALRGISAKGIAEMNTLESQRRSLDSKLEFMLDQRKSLQKELKEKEQKLLSLRNSQEGIQTFSTIDLNIMDESDEQKISRYLIQAGHVSLEQDEKINKKMALLKMDYLAAALTLGFIDMETAQKAAKANNISTKIKGINS